MGSVAEVTGLRDSRNSGLSGRSDEGTAGIVSSVAEVTGLRDSRNSELGGRSDRAHEQ